MLPIDVLTIQVSGLVRMGWTAFDKLRTVKFKLDSILLDMLAPNWMGTTKAEPRAIRQNRLVSWTVEISKLTFATIHELIRHWVSCLWHSIVKVDQWLKKIAVDHCWKGWQFGGRWRKSSHIRGSFKCSCVGAERQRSCETRWKGGQDDEGKKKHGGSHCRIKECTSLGKTKNGLDGEQMAITERLVPCCAWNSGFYSQTKSAIKEIKSYRDSRAHSKIVQNVMIISVNLHTKFKALSLQWCTQLRLTGHKTLMNNFILVPPT